MSACTSEEEIEIPCKKKDLAIADDTHDPSSSGGSKTQPSQTPELNTPKSVKTIQKPEGASNSPESEVKGRPEISHLQKSSTENNTKEIKVASFQSEIQDLATADDKRGLPSSVNNSQQGGSKALPSPTQELYKPKYAKGIKKPSHGASKSSRSKKSGRPKLSHRKKGSAEEHTKEIEVTTFPSENQELVTADDKHAGVPNPVNDSQEAGSKTQPSQTHEQQPHKQEGASKSPKPKKPRRNPMNFFNRKMPSEENSSEDNVPIIISRGRPREKGAKVGGPRTQLDPEALNKALQTSGKCKQLPLRRVPFDIGSPKLYRQSGIRTPPSLYGAFHNTSKRKGEPGMQRSASDTCLSRRPHEDDKRDRITLSEFVRILNTCIKKCCKEIGDVNIDETCLNFRIMCMKERCRERNRWIISDDNTRYDNVCSKTAKYTHACQYEQRSSITMQKQSGHKFGFTPSLSLGFMGSSVGASGTYEYNRGKSRGEVKDDGKLKTSTVTIQVEPNTAVVVKELTLIVEKTASCEVQVYLKKDDKISYSCREAAQKSVEIKKLCNGLRRYFDKWAKDDEETIVCFLETKCFFYSTEHRMETVELTSEKERYDRILKSFTYDQTSADQDDSTSDEDY